MRNGDGFRFPSWIARILCMIFWRAGSYIIIESVMDAFAVLQMWRCFSVKGLSFLRWVKFLRFMRYAAVVIAWHFSSLFSFLFLSFLFFFSFSKFNRKAQGNDFAHSIYYRYICARKLLLKLNFNTASANWLSIHGCGKFQKPPSSRCHHQLKIYPSVLRSIVTRLPYW